VFRYTRPLAQAFYEPISGGTGSDAPARALMYSYVTRWMRDFRVDGIRMDSVENVANWDFVGGYKDRARSLWKERWQQAGLPPAGADERFLVVGMTGSGRGFGRRSLDKITTVKISKAQCAMRLTAEMSGSPTWRNP
jgi:hypothetical protein